MLHKYRHEGKEEKLSVTPIQSPVESIGSCKNAKNCGNWSKTYLGNGYCMKCWDKGLGGGAKIPVPRKKGDDD